MINTKTVYRVWVGENYTDFTDPSKALDELLCVEQAFGLDVTQCTVDGYAVRLAVDERGDIVAVPSERDGYLAVIMPMRV